MLHRTSIQVLRTTSATSLGSCWSRPCCRPTRWTVCAGAASPGNSNNNRGEDLSWLLDAFPTYMQSAHSHNPDVCRDFADAVTQAERAHTLSTHGEAEFANLGTPAVWYAMRREAERDAAAEPLLSSFLYASILAHDSFERSLAFVLANRLANAVMLPTQLFEIFLEVLMSEPEVREGALADVEACRERDPACASYSQALLYYKGYHAIQTHRIAHALWHRGQKVMAVALQSRMSEVLAVDIHPAATFGKGILLDHGTGVVIGETAIIGNNVSLLQNVTLGGTGKEVGDRHPKISDNVLIGACATVLGNIRVGKGAQIAAGSLVLKEVPPHTMVAGSPAKEVGKVAGNRALLMQQWQTSNMQDFDPFYGRLEAQAPNGGTSASSSSSSSGGTGVAPTPPVQATAGATKPSGLPASPAAPVPSATPSTSSTTPSSSSSSSTPAPKDANGHAYKQAHVSPAALGVVGVQPAAGQPTTKAAPSTRAAAAIQPPEAVASRRAADGSSSSTQRSPAAAVQGAGAGSTSTSTPAGDGVTGPSGPGVQQAEQPAWAGRGKRPSTLPGVHEGSVDATTDDLDAAVKWANVKEDPEYVI